MDARAQQMIVSRLQDLLGPGLLAVYVYGSAASGRQRRESDIDLAVLHGGPLAALKRFETAQDLATLLHREVDLLDLHTAPAFIRGQVVGTGRRLFCSSEEDVGLFEAHALADYARLQEESREVIEAFDERYRS